MNVQTLFAHPATDEVFQRHLANDIRAARLPSSLRAYYAMRYLIPLRLRQLLQRLVRKKVADGWAIPSSFFEEIAHALVQLDGLMMIAPWPYGARCAVVLTHDVEAADGFRNVLRIADMEQELGFRSSWNFVPYKYAIDQGVLRELSSRSFEIGVHGYNHDGQLYRSRKVFERRVPWINDALHRFHASGFRSPMVHRNLEWLQSLDIEYDASCFDIDPFQPMPGGVGSVWPFSVGRFVELPYTLPQDHTLWIVLRSSDNRLWERKLDFLVANHGMVLMLTHPDYLTTAHHRELYQRFLLRLCEVKDAWQALPIEVARWWREREQSTVRQPAEGFAQIEGPAGERGVLSKVTVRDGHLEFSTEVAPASMQRT